MKKLLLVVSLLLLTGCGDVGVAALGSLVTGGVAYGSKVVIQDTEDAAIWRSAHRTRVSQCETKLMQRIDDLTLTDFDETLKRCEKFLMFGRDHQPQIFLERMQERVLKAREKSGATKN
jgi:hypothetical protein